MKEHEIIVKKCKDILKDFLKSKTIYTNGYATTMEGTIELRTHSSIEVYYPEANDKTHKEIRLEGFKLYDELYKKLEKYLDTYKIKIFSEHIEDGCYEIKINVSYEERL